MSDPATTPPPVISSPKARTARQRLRELERFAKLGRLSASLLHEISNPLTAALLYLEQYNSRQQSIYIRQVRRNILLLKRYVEAARQQVRQEGTVSNFYVRPQLDQVRRVFTPLARRQGLRLIIEPKANYRLYGDPIKFQQIITNLISNAIDAYEGSCALPANKQIIVRLSIVQQWLYVRVKDHGIGITADRLPYVFEVFYTSKSQQGHGLGIGLAIVKQHVENDFHGSIGVTSSPRHGTVFTAKLRLTSRYHKSP